MEDEVQQATDCDIGTAAGTISFFKGRCSAPKRDCGLNKSRTFNQRFSRQRRAHFIRGNFNFYCANLQKKKKLLCKSKK